MSELNEINNLNEENNVSEVNEAEEVVEAVEANEVVEDVVEAEEVIEAAESNAVEVTYEPVDEAKEESFKAEPMKSEANESKPYAYAPYTNSNEYVYTPNPVKNNSGKGGKVALTVIAVVLAIFVVAVSSISAFIAVTGYDPTDANVSNPAVTEGSETPSNPDDAPAITDAPVAEGNQPSESENNVDPEETVNRTYPTLSQLAAPEDALSLPDIYDKVSPSVVGVSCTMSRSTATGTGIIISADGYILTNAHVVEDSETVMIVDSEMNEYEAEIIGADTQTDIAVLKIEATDLPACEFGISSELRIGELAVAIGNPLGFDLYGTMTSGIISGLNRTITIGENRMTLIQTNASINSGNSGGPLIDAYGRVIGVTSAKVASTYGEGLGFAIPIDEALPIVEDLIKFGYVTGRPMIGVSGEDITSIMSMYYRLPQGVYVRFITPESAAEKAGIKAGDIIIGIQGETITTMDELNSIKNQYSAGDTITLTIYRDGKNLEVDLVLDEATTNE